MATDAQIQANRDNALRSTGPVSMGGKARSALNAITHGAYARGDIAISRGVFAEDTDELETMLATVTAALGPRDEIETQQAHHIASLINRRNRIDRFENHAIAAAGTHAHLNDLEDSADANEVLAALAALFSDARSDSAAEAEAYPWQRFAEFLIEAKNKGKQVWVRPMWTKDRVPETAGEWRDVTARLLKHFFGDPDDGDQWVLEQHYELMDRAAGYRAEAAELATSRLLDGLLEKTVRLSGTLGRQITEAVRLYAQLQERCVAASDAAPEPADDLGTEGASAGDPIVEPAPEGRALEDEPAGRAVA